MLKSENKFFIFDRPKNINSISLLKKILRIPFILFYKLFFKFINVKIHNKKYKISICAIFKNEAKYLKEWIEFHKIIGIEHFYLYNNNSTDNYSEALSKYIEEGLVTLNQWPKNQAQMECYHHCLENYKSETEWLSFLDIDEFIVPNTTNDIYSFLKQFQNKYPVVIAYWKMFGTSGKVKRNYDQLITEDLVVSWNKYTDIGKIFFNTAFDFNGNYKHNKVLHHYCWGTFKKISLPPVNIFGKLCLYGNNPIPKSANPSFFPLQINHYFTKSYEEYLEKKAKGDVYFKINPHDENYFYMHEMRNCNTDYRIYKYLIKLKLAMGKK